MQAEPGDQGPREFCGHYFGPNRTCYHGELCPYSHDVEGYRVAHGLNFCPNCGEFCKGKQCKDCHMKMDQTQFCRFKYGPQNYCNQEADCTASHDDDAYMAANDLKRCKCGKFCRGRQCRDCYSKTPRFCFAYFGEQWSCAGLMDGSCAYNHDVEAYKAFHGLNQCERCEHFCKGQRFCKNCSDRRHDGHESRQRHDTERIEKCAMDQCQEMTSRKYCRDCNDAIHRYQIPTYN